MEAPRAPTGQAGATSSAARRRRSRGASRGRDAWPSARGTSSFQCGEDRVVGDRGWASVHAGSNGALRGPSALSAGETAVCGTSAGRLRMPSVVSLGSRWIQTEAPGNTAVRGIPTGSRTARQRFAGSRGAVVGYPGDRTEISGVGWVVRVLRSSDLGREGPPWSCRPTGEALGSDDRAVWVGWPGAGRPVSGGGRNPVPNMTGSRTRRRTPSWHRGSARLSGRIPKNLRVDDRRGNAGCGGLSTPFRHSGCRIVNER